MQIIFLILFLLFAPVAQAVDIQGGSGGGGTDTNANTLCSGTTTYLDGEGNCDDLSAVYQPLDADLTALAADNTDFGTLTDAKYCVYDSANSEIDCTSDGAVAALAWNDIGDAGADGSIALAGNETDFTSTLDSNGKAIWTITNTDADTAADTAFLDFRHNDGADANIFYLLFVGDNDGTPQTDYSFSQTAALIRPDLTVTGTISTTGGLVVDATTETNIEAATDIVGDVDGTGLGAVDLDETAVETELEGVLDLDALQGAVTDAQVPDTITVDLATLASTVTVVDSTDASSSVAIFDSATGSLAVKTDAGLTYASDTGTLTATVLGTATLTLTGTGTINGLDAIDATGEATLESTLDIAGEVVSTGMGSTVIGDSITVTGWVMGASTATTPSANDDDTSLATSAYVQTELNAAGGRSLACASGSCDADVELYTRTICYRTTDPTAATDDKSVWINDSANGFTATKLWCESDQTVTMMLQVDDGSAADMDTVDLICVSTPDTDTSLDGDATIAAGDRVDIDVASVSGTPTWVTICWTGTYDD